MSTSLKAGDRVHVEYDGVVKGVLSVCDDTWNVRVTPDGHKGGMTYVHSEHVSVKEPEYEIGAAYISDVGYYYLRDNNGTYPWRSARSGQLVSDETPTRPLRKLVPEATE